MSVGPCPNPQENCPWFGRKAPKPLRRTQEHGCFSDEDHIIPRFLGRQATENNRIIRKYINLPENRQQICRWEHDEKTADDLYNPPELPPLEVMKAAIEEEKTKRHE